MQAEVWMESDAVRYREHNENSVIYTPLYQ